MKIDNILVRGTNWIGDAVMTTPALQRLRSSFPDSRITLLIPPAIIGLFEGADYIDTVTAYRRKEDGVSALFKTAKSLKRTGIDLAVLFQNAFEAALLARLAQAKLRVGFAEQFRGPLLTHKLHRGPEHKNRHQIRDYLDIVAECERICLGEDFRPAVESPAPLIVPSAHQRRVGYELIQGFSIDNGSGPLIVLNPGATNSRAKCWPAEKYAELADRLIRELKARIVIIGGPSELDYAERIVWRMKVSGAINLAGKTSMGELIGLLDSTDLLVSNDTGPAHIAAALGTPVLTIFGPTNEFETAPTGPKAEMIRAEGIECERCMHRDCPIDHRCMTRIEVGDVFERCARSQDGAHAPGVRADGTHAPSVRTE